MNKFILQLFTGMLLSGYATSQTTIIDTINYQGDLRNYRLFLPSGYTPGIQLPLVFNLHGFGSNALEQELYTQFNSVADTANFIVCHPNGLNNSWNVLGGSTDDVGFIDSLINLFHAQYSINLNRVYSTGLSNGGFMSNLLGCELANKIAAIAPVAGTTSPTIQSSCNPFRHVPVLYIHGTADAIVNYNGNATYSSALDLMNLWSSENVCQLPDTATLPDISTTDNSTVEIITWNNCDSNKQVIHYKVLGGGHTWPGAPLSIGVTNQDFNASGTIWEFFNRFELNTGINGIAFDNYIKTFPNPFTNYINVLLNTESLYTYSLVSLEGRTIKLGEITKVSFTIDCRDIPPGIYSLQVKFKNNSIIKKVIKLID